MNRARGAAGRAVRAQAGFTLAELLVVCAVLGVVLSGVLSMMMSGQQAYIFGSSQADAQQNVRVALERMAKEIREAGYSPRPPDTAPATCGTMPASACYAFPAVSGTSDTTMPTATSLTLKYDWDGSGAAATSGKVNDPVQCATGATCRGETVTYAFSGNTLTRQEVGVDASAQTLATGIQNLTFAYLDESDAVTTTVGDIRTVVITITARTQSRGAFVTMTDRVRLRNR